MVGSSNSPIFCLNINGVDSLEVHQSQFEVSFSSHWTNSDEPNFVNLANSKEDEELDPVVFPDSKAIEVTLAVSERFISAFPLHFFCKGAFIPLY